MKTRKILAWLLTFSLVLSLFACNKAEGITCPECDEECDADASFCPECGEKLNQTVECECGHENKAGAKFCAECGTSLRGTDDKDDEDNKPEDNKPEDNKPEDNKPEDNKPEDNKPGDNTPGDTEDDEKEETPPDPAESIWLKVRSQLEGSNNHTEYHYDYDGVLIAEYTYAFGKYLSKETYTYDSYGNVIYNSYYYLYYNGKNGNPTGEVSSGSRDYEHTYDENGKLIYTRFEDYDAWEYTYDENGVLIEEIEYSANYYSKEFIPYEKTVYEDGRKKQTYTYYNGSWGDPYEYKYDENGRLIEYEYAGGVIYSYDEHGNLICEEMPRYGTKTVYQYITLAEYRRNGIEAVKPNPDGSLQGGSGSGSGTSSGSGSGSSNQGTKCQHCKGGLFECSGCDGKGLVLKYYVSGSPVYGNCMACKGNGYITCPHCGGDGIFGN